MCSNEISSSNKEMSRLSINQRQVVVFRGTVSTNVPTLIEELTHHNQLQADCDSLRSPDIPSILTVHTNYIILHTIQVDILIKLTLCKFQNFWIHCIAVCLLYNHVICICHNFGSSVLLFFRYILT